VKNLRVEAGALTNGTLGGFTVIYNGQLCSKSKSMWIFKGYVSFYDYWNFEPHLGDTQRSARGESDVAMAAKYIKGMPFEVVSEYLNAEQYSFGSETNWAGFSSWDDAADHNQHKSGDLR
jgi:hypothetical protein